MAITIQAVMTNKGREVLAKSFGGSLGSFSWCYGKYFKIGTSAYQVVNGDQVPKSPDAALTNIESQGASKFWYKKSFVAADILYISPSSIQFRCFLDLAQANGNSSQEADTAVTADGPKNSASLSGETPSFFEIGIFDNSDNMIAYGTFPEESKLSNKTINHLVTLNF